MHFWIIYKIKRIRYLYYNQMHVNKLKYIIGIPRHKWQKLSHNEIEILQITIQEFKQWFKNLWHWKMPGPDVFTVNSTRYMKNNYFQFCTNSFNNKKKHFSIYPIKSVFLWYQVSEEYNKRWQSLFLNIDTKVPNKILANQIQQHIE